MHFSFPSPLGPEPPTSLRSESGSKAGLRGGARRGLDRRSRSGWNSIVVHWKVLILVKHRVTDLQDKLQQALPCSEPSQDIAPCRAQTSCLSSLGESVRALSRRQLANQRQYHSQGDNLRGQTPIRASPQKHGKFFPTNCIAQMPHHQGEGQRKSAKTCKSLRLMSICPH